MSPSRVRIPPSPLEGWQSGRMRRSRKPLSVVRRIESSNLSPSASLGETRGTTRVLALFSSNSKVAALQLVEHVGGRIHRGVGRHRDGSVFAAPTRSPARTTVSVFPCVRALVHALVRTTD